MSDVDPRVLRAEAIVRAAPEAIPCIVGPTASGKTALAIELCERIDGEIVSADSVQIYRHFDIGSGKPTQAELRKVRHHLIDACDPEEAIDARSYAERATSIIRDIRVRGRRPVVCGGTFLWVKSLVFGLAEAPPGDESIRNEHRAFATLEGRDALHRRLATIDPRSAARLHPNDFVRVSRALEVHALTGRRMSDIHDAHGFRTAEHRAHFVALSHTKEELTSRIEARVSSWLAGGWVEEVRGLHSKGFGGARAMGSVGYREITLFLRGELAEADLALAIVRATRVYARRQMTWLNHVEVSWI